MARERLEHDGDPIPDPEMERLNELEAKVKEMENDAQSATRDKWESVVGGSGKVVFGGALIAGALFGGGDSVAWFTFGIVGGGYIIKEGVGDLSEIPSKFSRAKSLATDSRFLRASLTSAMHSAIEGTAYKRLEDPNPKRYLSPPDADPSPKQ